MAVTWGTKPSGARNIVGLTVGTLRVESFAGRDPSGLRYTIRCTQCNSTWTETHTSIVEGHLSKGCRFDVCRLGRLTEKKITAHEKWIDSPDPVTPELPAAAAPKPVAPQRPRRKVEILGHEMEIEE